MRNILCQSRSEVKMAGESAHSRPESSSSAEEREERELPHVREGWEEREGEREQEEGEGESRRDQGRFGYFFIILRIRTMWIFCQQISRYYAESTFRWFDVQPCERKMPTIDIIIHHSQQRKADWIHLNQSQWKMKIIHHSFMR